MWSDGYLPAGAVLGARGLIGVRVSFSNDRELWQRQEASVRSWAFVADLAPEDRETDDGGVVVGRGEALVVELYGRDPYDALDEHSEAAMEIGQAIFPQDAAGLAEDFAEELEQLGDRVLVLSEIEVDEQ
jgi:hypothetical protein